jgi:hypothetical protein
LKGAAAPIAGIVLVAALGAAVYLLPRSSSDRLAASAQVDEHIQRARRLLLEYDPQLNLESEMRAVLGVEDFALAEEPDENKYRAQLTRNSKYLKSALDEVNQALAVSVGSVNARQDGAANRLRGMILLEQGLASAQTIAILRGEQVAVRTFLQRRANTLRTLGTEVDVVAASGIDDRIAETQAQLADLEQERATQQQLVSTLQERVERMNRELETTREQSDDVRARMDLLQNRGADLTQPGGVAEFERMYREAADRYRYLALEAQTLEFGSLENAAADDPAVSRYEPIIADQGIGYRRGLLHYKQDLDAAQTTLANLTLATDLARQSVVEMEGMKNALAQRAAAAEAAIAAEVDEIEGGGAEPTEEGGEEDAGAGSGGELESLLALDEEIRKLEDECVKKFDEAAQAFKTAAAGVASEMSSVGSAPDPARKEFHYSSVVANQGPIQGHIRAQQAEAILRKALLVVGQYQDAQANAAALRALGDFFKEQDQIGAWEEQAQQSRETAEGFIREAIELLEKAKTEVGNGNWIVAAEIGSAHYMLGLVDVDLAAEQALQWYGLALESREDQPFASEHVRMRNYIQLRAEH